ncbi:MAG: hypothetical protein JWR51_3387 [Devosia sp.]|uniref:hypothetical protein n=1 Tax=Devosia sp. TaxID=1871048 RepID=UPI00261393F4|nr:hypothetical protein [Devosia sp.]MDB5530284.1 hypothetical protein [Devosia sp.]
MMMTAIAGTVGAYIVLAVLLLSLNIASLWRWWIKAGAIVLTALVFIGSYIAITGLVGWASTSTMPARFSLLATRIVEPDKLRDTPGHIYLWIEEIDDNQIVISPPRAYEVPYDVEMATEVASAQSQLEGGSDIMGQFEATGTQDAGKQSSPNEDGSEVTMSAGNEQANTAGGPSGVVDNIPPGATISFSDMPAVSLPDKGPVVVVGN